MSPKLTVQGKIVYLRRLGPRDASPAYLRWLRDPAVNKFLEVRFAPPKDIGELRALIRKANRDPKTLLLGIFKCRGGSHIGNIKLGPINWRHRTAEIGFLIGEKKEWGKGFTSSSIRLMCEHAFGKLGLAKLTAGCYLNNRGSQRALRRAGFCREGRLIRQWNCGQGRVDGLIFGKLHPKYRRK